MMILMIFDFKYIKLEFNVIIIIEQFAFISMIFTLLIFTSYSLYITNFNFKLSRFFLTMIFRYDNLIFIFIFNFYLFDSFYL
jgi:hypothetical protein